MLRIRISAEGVQLGRCTLRANPTLNDVIEALGVSNRVLEKQDGARCLYIYDELGVSFLAEVSSGAVYWIMLTLENPQWRPKTESDPSSLFAGEIQIGNTKLGAPVEAQFAELLNEIRIRNFGTSFTVNGTFASKFCVSFSLNET